jgi:deoxyribodipyrimidine photo-lyase
VNGDPAIVLFRDDLRVHDNPALAAAVRAGGPVLPLFVIDERLCSAPGSANRSAFLVEALADLRHSLQGLGGQLYLRTGDPVEETMRLVARTGARAVHVAEGFTPRARRVQDRLERACRLERVELPSFPGTSVVPPGAVVPSGADHYRVFTPYWRRWRTLPHRAVERAPRQVRTPIGIPPGAIPAVESLSTRPLSPDRARGGETAGRRAAERWVRTHLPSYSDRHDDLAGDHTSRLSPYLHFGCISANELVAQAAHEPGAEPFVRQLCWRDFHHQVLAAFPELAERDYRPRPGATWIEDEPALRAWREGRTGVPIVDAGMHQLLAEGWMQNRARLIVASYLVRERRVHWRAGAAHFMDWLLDADVASNYGNWQWVAGTGNDTRPNRRLNLARQAQRFDPRGEYVRRYLAGRDRALARDGRVDPGLAPKER